MVSGATSRQGKCGGASGKAKHGHGTTGTGAHYNKRKKSKLIVTFDSEKRREYLTGFHKRKQERRRFGLDMEAYKVKRRQLEAKKQRREEQKEMLAGLKLLEDEENKSEAEDCGDNSVSTTNLMLDRKSAVTKVMTFNDEFTQRKFGDVVTVTTSVGEIQSDNDESDLEMVETTHEKEDDGDQYKHSTIQQTTKKKSDDQKQHLTLFQRIQQQRKGKALPSKRSKLKEARTARKAIMGKKSKSTVGGNTGKKRGVDDSNGRSSAFHKLSKKLKMKSSQGGGNKRQKMR